VWIVLFSTSASAVCECVRVCVCGGEHGRLRFFVCDAGLGVQRHKYDKRQDTARLWEYKDILYLSTGHAVLKTIRDMLYLRR
jgi:hypothetical protein